MRKLLIPGVNQELELQLRESIKQHALSHSQSYDPYAISKVLRYLYSYNDGTQTSVEVFQALGERFLKNLHDRMKAMKEMPFDDPLIDMDAKDIVDIVRVYSAYSKNKEERQALFVPKLFEEESEVQTTQQSENTEIVAGQSGPVSLQQVSHMILQSLTEIIKKKETSLKFSQVSDLMYHFVNGDMSLTNKNFVYFLEKVADDQLTLKEEFNTLNSTKLLWAYGKFMNRTLAPHFASQVSSSIVNRYDFSAIRYLIVKAVPQNARVPSKAPGSLIKNLNVMVPASQPYSECSHLSRKIQNLYLPFYRMFVCLFEKTQSYIQIHRGFFNIICDLNLFSLEGLKFYKMYILQLLQFCSTAVTQNPAFRISGKTIISSVPRMSPFLSKQMHILKILFVEDILKNSCVFSRVPTVNHRLHRKAIREIIHQKKQISSDNFALSLYACASVGFYEKEFFDNAIAQFRETGKTPSVQNLGYIVQAMATLRKNEHVQLLTEWVKDIIEEKPELFLSAGKDFSTNDYSFAQILQGLAFLQPTKLPESIHSFLEFYQHQLSIDISPSFLPVIPSLAWSISALSKSGPNKRLLHKLNDCIFSTPDNFSRLQFSDLVLLNQLSNDPICSQLLKPSQDQIQIMEQIATRHDQLELKHNCFDYKKFNGADTVNEFVQALKFISYDSKSGLEIERYNPVRGGYLQLADLKVKGKDVTVVVENRFDCHGDGETVNGYEKVRRQQVQGMLNETGRKVHNISYKRLAALKTRFCSQL